MMNTPPEPVGPVTPPNSSGCVDAIAVEPVELGVAKARSALRSASERDPMQIENFRGEVFVGNTRGMKYAEKMAESKALESRLSNVEESLKSLQESHQSLQESQQSFQESHQSLQESHQSLQESHQSERARLLERISNLESNNAAFTGIRNRFLSVFKRTKYGEGALNGADEKWISAGNNEAHGGNAKFDSTLYTTERKDYNVYKTLYGIHPSIVNSLDDESMIGLLDKHATDTSSKCKRVTDVYEQRFQDFIQAWDRSGNAAVKLNEPNSDLTRAYYNFFACAKTEVIKIQPDDKS